MCWSTTVSINWCADEADFSSSLDKRLREMSPESRAVTPSADSSVAGDTIDGPVDYNDPSRDSFSDAGDDDIAKALASRIGSGSPSTCDQPSAEDTMVISDDEYLSGTGSWHFGPKKQTPRHSQVLIVFDSLWRNA